MSNFKQYTGCFHIHFPVKLYREMIKVIADDAKKSGVNFIFLSPHTPEMETEKKQSINYFQEEGYYGKTMVFTGEEIDERSDKNHVITYGQKKWMGKISFEKSLPGINDENGLAFIAHPFGRHRIFILKSDHHWDKGLRNVTGIEIWSLLFDLVQNRTLFTLPWNYLDFPYNLRGPGKETLDLWDRYLNEKKITGIAGLDIHKLPLFWEAFDIKKSINYKFVFKVLRNLFFTLE